MIYNVVLIGRAGPETDKLKDHFAEDSDYRIEAFDTASLALSRLSKGDISLLVLSFDVFNREKTNLLNQFRDSGFEYPTIVFAKAIAPETYKIVESFNSSILLERPCEKKRMWGVIEKMVSGNDIKQPVFRRYFTDQPVDVQSFDNKSRVGGRIYNLSQGGAYIECEDTKTRTFKPGDIVRFSVKLTELARQHTVSGRVMWSTSSGENSGRPGIGVMFVKSGDVYNEMMKKL